MTTRNVDAFEVRGNIKRKLRVEDIDNSQVNIGTVPDAAKAYVSAVNKGDGVYRQTVLTLTAVPITMRDTEQGGGFQIFTFPAGRITPIGAIGTIAVTTTSALESSLNAASTCNWGVGSATQSSATVATTEQNFVNVGAFTSSATINVAGAAANASGIGIVTSLDGTSTPIAAFLNLAVAGASDIDGDATVIVTGSVTLTYVVLGDY
jgi:hypothetical protein